MLARLGLTAIDVNDNFSNYGRTGQPAVRA
jgi:hypothetical protein